MADDQRPTLSVEERSEIGSRQARRLRRAGLVPGVVYGGDGETVSFKVGFRELRRALGSHSAVIDLEIGSQEVRPVIVKDQQIHPVRDDILHVDMLQVRLDEKIQSTVAVELEGGEEAPGVKEGGVLEHITRELAIEALPTDIPERVVANVSGMDVAATLVLGEVTPPRGVEFLDDPDETVIATIVVPTEVEEPEIEEETELVGEEAPEGEEAPAEEGEEGAAPADGEEDGGASS